MTTDVIHEMIEQTVKICESWLKKGEDGLLRFTDPLDGEEISAHYGASHAAVSFIIYGEKTGNRELSETGYSLLKSILKRWKTSMQLPAFHNDFNNFALCAVWEYFESADSPKTPEQTKLAEQIKTIILSTPDSKNPTVNWFPMRWYVNLLRFRWTGDEKYKANCDTCRRDIRSATFQDGFIDDRLPLGLSFNLQYDVATVAVMQYLRSAGEEIDLAGELGALINAAAPDGDINYLGRGTNQIFAWGLWIYLLSSAGREEQLDTALQFLKDKVPAMLANNNMMLNEWPGAEKYMWWDYHYCSVYTAHFLFWLIMAETQQGKLPVKEKITEPKDSGLKIYRGEDYFAVTFSGRREYLSEKGPCLAALWTKKTGMLIKGTFGPWQGAFGNKYSPVEAVIRNFAGLYKAEQNRDFSKNRIIHRVFPNLEFGKSEKIRPLFAEIRIEPYKDYLSVTWVSREHGPKMLSLPCTGDTEIRALVDGREIRLLNTSMIRNQYSWVKIYQTDISRGTRWEIQIKR